MKKIITALSIAFVLNSCSKNDHVAPPNEPPVTNCTSVTGNVLINGLTNGYLIEYSYNFKDYTITAEANKDAKITMDAGKYSFRLTDLKTKVNRVEKATVTACNDFRIQ